MSLSELGIPRMSDTSTKRRLLLVDDNAEGRRALARLLEMYQFDVVTAADGSSAMEAMHAGPPPDIVLTDMLLPDLDGREVAREAHALSPAPVVILITGWDFGSDPLDRERWGIDQVFFKPLNITDLVATLRQTLPEAG